MTHRHNRLRTLVAAAALALPLAACGNAQDSKSTSAPSVSDATSPSSVPQTSSSSSSSTSTSPKSSSSSTKPGQTMELRAACTTTNTQMDAANRKWNDAVKKYNASKKSEDLQPGTKAMSALAKTLREEGKASGNATFKQKVDATAEKVEQLASATDPKTTVSAGTYNDSVASVTKFCSDMFPPKK